jgi:hypothetical protein
MFWPDPENSHGPAIRSAEIFPRRAAPARAAGRERLRRMDRGCYRLIGSGGVFDADDACRKIRLVADAVGIDAG